ncbi:hypothetical protein HDU67_006515 [Dinochytrium kinnereticum]|nr:hypothetical protein HDU67_006515 [Dinochytrium kinnereticum]
MVLQSSWASLRIKDQTFFAPNSRNQFALGRSKKSDIILGEKYISNKHFQLIRNDDEVLLEDLSKNGTRVNGVLVGTGKSVIVASGDTITVGTKSKGLQYEFTQAPKGSMKRKRTEEEENSGKRAKSACGRCTGVGSDGFVCEKGQDHMFCVNCNTSFPNRGLPEQRCQFCQSPFCSIYLGACRRHMIREFMLLKDYKALAIGTDFFKSNRFEQSVIDNYLKSNNISTQQVILECLDRIESNTLKIFFNGVVAITSNAQDPGFKPVSRQSYSCARCASILFEEFCFQYRLNLDEDKLPANVKGRPNCWYGRGCRTQTHNQAHAAKLNHMCEATR